MGRRMLRVIFDTNVYGLLILEKNIENFRKKIVHDPHFLVYGFQPIRKELRDVPKAEKLGKRNKRNLILSLYDELTKGRYFSESLHIDNLAKKFYHTYRNFGGIRSWKETNISVDFTIVACACLHNLDVLVSNDMSTLLSKPARKAYRHICMKQSLREPTFWTYEELKEKYGF
jgi:hypothetical protein